MHVSTYHIPCAQEFVGDDKGRVKGIRTVKVKWTKVKESACLEGNYTSVARATAARAFS